MGGTSEDNCKKWFWHGSSPFPIKVKRRALRSSPGLSPREYLKPDHRNKVYHINCRKSTTSAPRRHSSVIELRLY